jgi:hypothetical protein
LEEHGEDRVGGVEDRDECGGGGVAWRIQSGRPTLRTTTHIDIRPSTPMRAVVGAEGMSRRGRAAGRAFLGRGSVATSAAAAR